MNSQMIVGTKLDPKVLKEITLKTLKDYAHASSDHNPIHQDEVVAKNQGLPGVITHGMLSMSYAANYALSWVRDLGYSNASVMDMNARFRAMVYLGDQPKLEGKVIQVSENQTECVLDIVLYNGQNAPAVTLKVKLKL